MADEARMDPGLQRPYGSPASGPPGATHETSGIGRERSGSTWHEAKETARATLNEQKDTAARSIGDVAQALRDAGSRQEGDSVARLTGSAADGLERVSNALRNKDVNSMLHDMDRFAREQPVAFFGLAVAAGFLALRLMRDGIR
jgi:hypothetical protein